MHLALQQFEHSWEVIVVNNNSSDGTVLVAQQEWDKYLLPGVGFSIVNEQKPGLNNARQKGVQAANYEYLIFCDDDNWLENNFLAIAYDLFKTKPGIGAAGGQCIAEPENGFTLPPWFEDYQNNYAIGKQAEISGDITKRGYLWGAGLITTKTIFNKCITAAFPFLLTDRMGNLLSSGGDTELCSRIILCGYSLYYDERLVLKHFIPGNRLSVDYLDKLLKGINETHAQLSKYYNLIYAGSVTGSQKAAESIKSFLKIILSVFTKRWDTNREKQMLYIYTGINLGVDRDLVLLRKFKNEPARSA